MESSRKILSPNPREKSGLFSIITFAWTLPLFKKGYTRILELNDIPQSLKSDKSNSLGQRLEKNWNEQLAKSERPSLTTALIKTFWKEFGLMSFAHFCCDLISQLGQPFLLGQLLLYFRKNSTVTYNQALMYACGIVFFNVLQAVSWSQLFMMAFHNGMKMRVAICCLIYRKALRLSQTALGETAPGKIVNLLSNDVSGFELMNACINALWLGPLLSLIVAISLWGEIGYAGLIGIIIILIIVQVQSYTGKLQSKYRLQTALRTDQRIRFMDEIISGVQVIKMYAWEIPFANLILTARKLELKIIQKTSYVRGVHLVLILFTTRCAVFCAMLAVVLLYGSNEITADKVFVISTYYSIIATIMSRFFVRAVATVAEVRVALNRLQNFLELDEKHSADGYSKNNAAEIEMVMRDSMPENIAVSLKNATTSWKMPSSNQKTPNKIVEERTQLMTAPNLDEPSPTLCDINVDFPKGKLIGVIGPVGAGKSSFLQVLLRELPLDCGSMSISGSISYASQEPWVFAASVRQNILFGEEYDHDRYKKTAKMCALLQDFHQFENGDRLIVGEKGTLSGGQKARINLARACYRNADIYLLDDPLSAVDAHVGTQIFSKCIGPKGYLAQMNKTRILVTHQVHFLKEADWLVVLNNGKIEIQGTPNDLVKSGLDFSKYFGPDEDPDDSKEMENRQQLRKMSTASNISSETSNFGSEIFRGIGDVEDKGVQMEESSKGKVKGSISFGYFTAGAHWSVIFILASSCLVTQILASLSDYWLSVWTREEETQASWQMADYRNGTMNFSSHISSNDSSPSNLSTETCVYVQGALIGLMFLFGTISYIGFFKVCIRASRNIYISMFNSVIYTKMRFFDTNPSGRILNRFSKDIGSMDDLLPRTLMDGIQTNLNLLGSIVITAMINPYFLIPIFVMAVFFIYVRKVYLKTSKNIKRIEGVAKSPAFTHLAATLSGLSTIRAFKAETLLMNEFDHHQDTHSACWFMFIATSSAFGLSLDFMCWIFVSCVIFFFMLFDTGASGEMVGLAIFQALRLTGTLQWGIRQSSDASNHMTSAERALEYCGLDSEPEPKIPQKVTDNWPAEGSIKFRNVFYMYFEDAEPVLRNLSLAIKSKEKIGIVGRTGAGKSSIIGAIFRLACIKGTISIDGVDTANIRLRDLRKRIAIIPQDPVLFSGTLRSNLDPFEEYPDEEIWNALEKVELKETVAGPLGLQSQVMARGANYSVGQRQLLCLARAILRKNRILLMDEATANVDPKTDLLIQQTIREKFAECTVLTIAHRLHTIIDSDRVLVMNAGEAAEFDEPHILLQNNQGIFYGIVKALGIEDFDRMASIAHEKYTSSRNS